MITDEAGRARARDSGSRGSSWGSSATSNSVPGFAPSRRNPSQMVQSHFISALYMEGGGRVVSLTLWPLSPRQPECLGLGPPLLTAMVLRPRQPPAPAKFQARLTDVHPGPCQSLESGCLPGKPNTWKHCQLHGLIKGQNVQNWDHLGSYVREEKQQG